MERFRLFFETEDDFCGENLIWKDKSRKYAEDFCFQNVQKSICISVCFAFPLDKKILYGIIEALIQTKHTVS